MIYSLKPRFSYRKSFYGKAFVIEEKNKIKLQSYSTIVAEITKKKCKTVYKYLGYFSRTTSSH